MVDGSPIGELNHVVLAVRHLHAAEAFFSKLLGVRFRSFGEHEREGFRSLYCSKRLELIAPTRPDGPVARFLDHRGDGIYAVGFRALDAGAARSHAEAVGAVVVGDITGGELGEMPDGAEMREIWIHPKSAFGIHMLLAQGSDDLLHGV
jgi:methylmalonyl-CoA/ethylmalonyl-CoA epimerase